MCRRPIRHLRSCLGLSTDIAADEEDNPLKEWRWGPVVASAMCDAIEALLRFAGAIATPTQLAVIRRARPRVIAARAEIGRQRKAFDEIWDSMPIKRIEPDQAYWRARLAAFRLTMTADASPAQVATDRASVLSVAPTAVPDLDQMVEAQPGREIAAQVWSAVRSLEDVLPVLEEMWGTPPAAVVQLDRWKELLTAHKLAPESQNHTLRLLIRLLALDTTTWLTANNDVNPGTNVPIQSAFFFFFFAKLLARIGVVIGGVLLTLGLLAPWAPPRTQQRPGWPHSLRCSPIPPSEPARCCTGCSARSRRPLGAWRDPAR